VSDLGSTDALGALLDALQSRRGFHLRIDHTSAAWRARLRAVLETGVTPRTDYVWLDGNAAHPWLLTPWPDDLREALLAVNDAAIGAAAWAKRSGVMVVIEGGSGVTTALQPDSLRGARVVWLPRATGVESDGWAMLSAAENMAPTEEIAALLPNGIPIELAAISTDFTLACARVVTGRDDLNLEELILASVLERTGPGRWQLLPHLREQLLARANPVSITEAKAVWHATLLTGWPPTPGEIITVTANVAEAAAVWHDWWLEGRSADWTRLVNGMNRWARRHGEQLRVRFWHQAMLKVASERGESRGTQGQLALGVARCEDDLMRYASTKTWGERALALLPEDHPLRLNAYKQLSSTHFANNDLPSAIAALERGLAFGEQTGCTAFDLLALKSDLAFFLLLSGRPAEAEVPLLAAIAEKRTRPGHFSLVPELNIMVMLQIALGRPVEALATAEEAVAGATRESHVELTPFAYHVLAMALLECGRIEDAYRAVVGAMATCVPQLHAALLPLVELTQRRVEIHARNDHDAWEKALTTVEQVIAGPSLMRPYAGLLLAEALGLAMHDRTRALSLLEHLAQPGVEGHVQGMFRTATRHIGATPDGEPPALAASVAEQVSRLLESFGAATRV